MQRQAHNEMGTDSRLSDVCAHSHDAPPTRKFAPELDGAAKSGWSALQQRMETNQSETRRQSELLSIHIRGNYETYSRSQ